MDDRKKRIEELERTKQESRSSLDALLESFGENLYTRAKDMQVDSEDFIQYSAYLKDIAESNTAIGKIEEKNRRFRELVDSIETKELEEKERVKGMSVIFRKMGKVLLGDASYNDFTFVFREQADNLEAKLESLEKRVAELENKEGGNVFTWIGKGAQGLVLRSFLTKAQESQEQLFMNIGERFSQEMRPIGENTDLAALSGELEGLRKISHTASDEILLLRNEKQMISAGYDLDGNPQKQIQAVRNHINQVRDDLRCLYRNFGAQATGIMDQEILPDRKYFIDTIVTAEDGEIIGRAVRINQSISDHDTAISKLRASLAVDEEKIKIDKFQKSIRDKKNTIYELEKEIIELESSVVDAQANIEELQKFL